VSFDPARARLEVDVVAGRSAATAACASNPLKILIPRPRGGCVWACLGSFGGGFVAGDETSLDVRVGANARCYLTTQASTKIYRNPRLRPCGHTLRAKLEADALLVLAPDPVQSFAGSTYTQRQEFYLQPGAGLVLLDWFCSGRAARHERWFQLSGAARPARAIGGRGRRADAGRSGGVASHPPGQTHRERQSHSARRRAAGRGRAR
jgi:urease accessory protein